MIDSEEEDEDETSIANKILAKKTTPYAKMHRDRFEGRLRLGDSLTLRDDIFSLGFLYCFKLG